jgi:hypothetical protein
MELNYPRILRNLTTEMDTGAKTSRRSPTISLRHIRTGQYWMKADETLLEVLRQRRDRIAQYWFRRVAPLDHFEVLDGRLKFEDLVLKGGYDAPGDTSYTVTFHGSGKDQALRLAPGSPIHLPSGHSSLIVQIVRTSSTWPEQKLKVRLAQRAGNSR